MQRFASILALSLVCPTGCAYQGMYKQTNNSVTFAPVAPRNVQVARNKEAVSRAWTELGSYTGHAPTVTEAMDTAKQQCGAHGANFYILNTEPFQSEGVWKVDGLCARAK